MQKHDLMELLKDMDIRKIIRQIFKEADDKSEDSFKEELQKQKEKLSVELENRLSQIKIENQHLKTENLKLPELENKLSQIKMENQSLKTENLKLNQTVDFYRKNFEEELRVYEVFQSLTDETKGSIGGIFKNGSLAGFVACGVQENSISSLWDFISAEMRNNQNDDIENLKKIFYFLFARFALANPIFRLQEGDAGSGFDPEKYAIHHQSSARAGNIKELVLRGWINTATNKIIKKSIVKI